MLDNNCAEITIENATETLIRGLAKELLDMRYDIDIAAYVRASCIASEINLSINHLLHTKNMSLAKYDGVIHDDG